MDVTNFRADFDKYPRLTREREHVLAVKAKKGNKAALDELVRSNLRYVLPIALRYRRYGVPIADLVSEGALGLMVAAEKFDPERGTRFVTYCAHWAKAMMLDFVIRNHSLVRLSAGSLRSKVFFQLRKDKDQLLREHGIGRDEAIEILAARYGTNPERLSRLAVRLEARDVAGDAPMAMEANTTVFDNIPTDEPSQEETFATKERALQVKTKVLEAVALLDERERFIVRVRVMADDPEEMSLAELGRTLGVSRERARQIEARAKEKLRQRLAQVVEHAA
jgi:RNA polymerase sigma-32 factor